MWLTAFVSPLWKGSFACIFLCGWNCCTILLKYKDARCFLTPMKIYTTHNSDGAVLSIMCQAAGNNAWQWKEYVRTYYMCRHRGGECFYWWADVLCTQHTQTYNRPVNILTFYSSAPVSHDCATVSQRLETGADKWSSAIIHFIIYTSAFPSGTCQNVLCGKGPLTVTDSFMLMWFIWYVGAVKQMINNEFSHKMSVGKQSSSSSYTPLILTLFPYSSSFVSVTYFVSLLSPPPLAAFVDD